ncbi:MAG: V-type ATP synthase subunit E [Sphaerochaetaceae bacterium]|nr:V-type ATP synthase subunit E [Sphaerochaetaceae bacterium]MDC7249463.1 V-type ATP synthase subunit E [Sphaerochaetaceae bacterium]
MDTDNKLLKGISLEAQEKAAKILAEAQNRVDEIIVQSSHKIEKELAKEDKEFENLLVVENLKVKSAKKAAERKVQLEALQKQYDFLYTSVKEEIYKLLDGKEASTYLEKWMLEAVLGLGLDEAKIAFSASYPITEEMLKKVEKTAKKEYNLTLKLQLDTRRLVVPGVVATSLDGKVSFNNQVDVRMRRFDRDIKIAIQEGICPQE